LAGILSGAAYSPVKKEIGIMQFALVLLIAFIILAQRVEAMEPTAEIGYLKLGVTKEKVETRYGKPDRSDSSSFSYDRKILLTRRFGGSLLSAGNHRWPC